MLPAHTQTYSDMLPTHTEIIRNAVYTQTFIRNAAYTHRDIIKNAAYTQTFIRNSAHPPTPYLSRVNRARSRLLLFSALCLLMFKHAQVILHLTGQLSVCCQDVCKRRQSLP